MYGLDISSSLRLPGLASDASRAGDVGLDLAPAGEVDAAFSGPTADRARLTLGEGETVDVVLGVGGDLLLTYGDRARFHISRAGDRVLCAPSDVEAIAWQRVLVDTVLGTTAMVRGHEALHAAGVELDGGVVAIAAPTGGGKSTLCAELMLRGARLFSDDMVFLAREGAEVLAHPGPPLMNLGLDWPGDRAEIGDLVAIEAGEAWIAARRASSAAAPLLAVFLLERRAEAPVCRLEEGISAVELLGIVLQSGPDQARRRARFELLSDLARSTPILRLVASTSTAPSVLADAIEAAAGRLSAT